MNALVKVLMKCQFLKKKNTIVFTRSAFRMPCSKFTKLSVLGKTQQCRLLFLFVNSNLVFIGLKFCLKFDQYTPHSNTSWLHVHLIQLCH